MGIEAEVGKALNCAIFVKQSTEHGADKCVRRATVQKFYSRPH